MTIQKGSCHCGAVKFEIHGPIRDFRRCDCSICRRKGAVMCTADRDQFHLVEGEEHLGLYQWNTRPPGIISGNADLHASLAPLTPRIWL